ncbi:MAG: tetratricopeptide repeat protein [Candidatus Aminicenantes bacterium]|nr:tetratricopeptide repeat protein [Candidatus Aminicenantes bacterium]
MAMILHNLAVSMQDRGVYALALEKYEQSLKIRKEIGDKLGIGQSLHQVGIIYQMKGDYATALEKYEQALKIAEELGDKLGIAKSLHQVGSIYHLQKKYPEAFENHLIAFLVMTELESPDAQIAANNLNDLRKDWGEKEFEEAMRKKSNDE